MAIQFHPLPPELFSDKARPYIKRLNAELREVFGLEGAIRQPINAKRSDNTISRRASFQVDVSRITPSISEVVSGVSTVVGTPALTFGTANTVGSTTTAVSINSAIALFGTQAPRGLSLSAAVGTSGHAARADHVHAGFDATAPGALGSTAATGSVDFAARRDHQHLFPPTLRSTANASTLALTDDATDQTLTGSLGALNVTPAGAFALNASGRITFNLANSASASTFIISPNSSASEAAVVSVQGRATAGNRTLILPNWFAPAAGDTFSNTTIRCWDSQFSSFTGQYTGCTFVGYDMTTVTIAPSSGSSSGNCLYGIKNSTFQINNGNASWTEVAAGLFRGFRRSLASPRVDVQAALILEPPTGASTTQAGAESPQIGLLIRQQSAQTTAANRYGIKIDAQNSGTNRRAIYVADAIENATTDMICSAAAKGLITKDAQGTPRYWRIYIDTIGSTATAGDATLSIDAAGAITATRAGGATGQIDIHIVDVGTSAPTT
jgi:hypothetical protein